MKREPAIPPRDRVLRDVVRARELDDALVKRALVRPPLVRHETEIEHGDALVLSLTHLLVPGMGGGVWVGGPGGWLAGARERSLG